jgi:hypothetical protein
VQVHKLDRAAPPAAYERAATTLEAAIDEPFVAKWPRRSRFLFILGAASLCWAIPAALVYWLILPH